jgi:hypothetical protein
MNARKRVLVLLSVLITFSMIFGSVLADDGIMHRRNVPKTPELETERANLNHMSFYVPAQKSDGTLLTEGVTYLAADGSTVETREYAKPLVSVYIDALPEEHEEIISVTSGGAGIGAHDAYAAVSLDDGATWKRTNLSTSADLSSFTLANGIEFPGDAHNMTFAIAGDKVLIGWISRYCDGGSPSYTFTDDDVDALQTEFGLPDLYVHDIWGVAGAQDSVDFTLQGFPEVGEIPYSCVWSARGQLVALDDTPTDGPYDILWTKAERLTSGRRDANRLEMNADSAAGFMMTWQEDPDGLRPGLGLGPGEGWSGAVVNQQTDLWYSFISIEDFVKVADDTDVEDGWVTLEEYALDTDATLPKPAVPMAMPIRLTDNAMCKASVTQDNPSFPYCYVDFDTDPDENGVVNPYLNTVLPDILPTDGSSNATFCSTTVSWTPPGGSSDLTLCVAEDGRVLGGRVGASRPRVNVQPYNSLFITDEEDDTTWYDSAIVIMGAEENKALGEGVETDGGEPPVVIEPEDLGKNMMYYSFDLRNPSFVLQGGMLNRPAVDPETGAFFELLVDDFENEFYETEISRRFSHMSQPIHQFGDENIGAVLIVKQGIINQGGPADIFLRMTKADPDLVYACDLDNDGLNDEKCLPEGYNPYAYENLDCTNLDGSSGWVYLPSDEDDTRIGEVEANPRYVQGLCTSTMINVSGTTIEACDGTEGDCADAFPWDGVLDGTTFPKVTEWSQSGPNYGDIVDETNVGNLDDESWENPYDVAKGHRGYIDGDFIMMMYAWSPNWQANSVGNDHYNLYARRSFDGGESWTTLPDTYTHVDGSVWYGLGTCTTENFGTGDNLNSVETCYDAGVFEQARNLSQLTGNKVTILDPRYTPTGGLKMLPITDLKDIGFSGYVEETTDYVADDIRNPSIFFIVYETGDNTTVAEGEAVPMDLFYSRATNFGDDYALVEYANTGTGVITMGFDWLEHDLDFLSGEAANTCNNGGTYYYVIWNQWEEDAEENVHNSDAMFRRVFFFYDELLLSTETAPVARILSAPSTALADDQLTFYGGGYDPDNGDTETGIVSYDWYSSLDGFLGSDQILKISADQLSMGMHIISLVVTDDEGVSSREARTILVIAGSWFSTELPMMNK